jgi:hypothetical protein
MKNAKSGAMSHHYIGQAAFNMRPIADRSTFPNYLRPAIVKMQSFFTIAGRNDTLQARIKDIV